MSLSNYQASLLASLIPDQEAAAPAPLPSAFVPKLNPVQMEVYNDPAIYLLSYGERGCLSQDTPVYTDVGLSRYRDLPTTGGLVSWDGISTLNKNFFDKAVTNKPVVLTTLSNGGQISSSEEHPIWVCAEPPGDEARFGFWTMKRIQSLRLEGWRFFTPLIAHPNWTQTEKVSALGYTITEDIGYMLGALVGDGSLNKISEGRHSIYFSNLDTECIARVASGASVFGASISYSKSAKCAMWFTPKHPMSDFIVALGLDKLSYFKRIPAEIIRSPKSVATSFLRGLFDTDGTISPTGRIAFTSTSKDLIQDTLTLLTALGIFATVLPFKSASGRPTWTMNICGIYAEKFGEEIGFEIKRKQQRLRSRGVSKHPHHFQFPPSITSALVSVNKEATPLPNPLGLRYRWYPYSGIPSRNTLDEILSILPSPKLKKYNIGFAWVELLDSRVVDGVLYDLTVPSTGSYLAAGMIHHNSGKTVGALHKMVKHCYENFNALAIIIVGVRRQAKEGGAAEKLALDVLPQWKEGQGLEFTEWKSNTAKDEYLFISNRYGGWSRVLLLSMPVESYVKDRSKGLEPSFILIDEAQTLESDAYFSALVQQLGRRPNIQGPQQYIACCNPEGPSNWVYKRFFLKSKDDDGKPIPDYSVHHVPISDNETNLPPGYYDRVKEALKDDDVEYRRLVLGEWVDRPTGASIFGTYYSEARHLRGDDTLGDRILPNPKYPITVGYDLGTANSAVIFTQNLQTKDKDIWVVFDELVFTDAYIPYTELVPAIMRRQQFWNETMKTKFQFEHISDSSAFNQFRATSGTYDSWEVERISREVLAQFPELEPIVLIECPKPPNSVQARVKVVIRALQTDRFFVSASCKRTREMLLHLESEKLNDSKYSPDLPFKPKRSKHIHGFDALSYPMFYYELDTARQFLRLDRKASELLPVGIN